MKNDFDFIRDKIENSGVNAPAEMDENFVMNKLEGVQPDTNAAPELTVLEPKKRRYGLITGLAAAIVAVVVLSIFGAMYFNRQQAVDTEADAGKLKPVPAGITAGKPSVKSDVPLKKFDSYDDLKKQAAKIMEKVNSYTRKYDNYEVLEDAEAGGSPDSISDSNSYATGSSGSSSGSKTGGSESFSETYKQVEGVDEADIVKTDGRYLYIASKDGKECIYIYNASYNPERVAVIDPEGDFNRIKNPNYTPDGDDAYDVFVEEMYFYDGKLVVCCLNRGNHFEYNTTAFVYDVSDINDIRITEQFNQSGYYSTSRMIGDNLYIISEYSVYGDDFEIPYCYRGAEKNEIPIDCVYSVEEPVDSRMLIVGCCSLADGSSYIQSAAILGSLEDVYCNQDNLYIYATHWHWDTIVDYDYMPDDKVDYYIPPKYEPVTTDIYKVSLKDGIAFTAFGTVQGSLDSRYSLDEKDGYLRVAATVEDEDYNQSNALYILDSDLQQVGYVTGIAKDESIKAVRYVGDVAYVITYEQTDPLFVIDVSDPANPAVLGEVKIDGFSSMLVPVDENTMLGLGYYTEDRDGIDMQVQMGFKLALFDVSDKMNPKVLDEKVYRNYYSSVMEEPRALVYNPDRGDYLIPMNFIDYHLDSNTEYYQPDVSAGALNFKVENGKLVEIDHPEVDVKNNEEALVDRCLYVGKNIYMIANGYYTETMIYTTQYK